VVPLSERAVEILRKMAELGAKGYVFKGAKEGMPLSNMAGLKLLQRMGRDSITVHGFRSSFRDWAGETTAFPREVIEHALAHRIPDKAEAAYARGTLLVKRAKLMQAWADYCAATGKGNVTQLHGAAHAVVS
jgi:integrase